MNSPILYLIDSLGRGGAETFLLNLCAHLQRDGLRCDIAYLSAPHDLASQFHSMGLNVYFLNSARNPLKILPRLRELQVQHNYSAIHSHLFNSSWNLALYSLFSRDPKHVFTFHSLEFDYYKASTPAKLLQRAIFRFCLQRSGGIFTAVSKAVQESVGRNLGIAGVLHTPIGVPQAVSSAVQRSEESEPGKAFKVLVPAGLKPVKGHADILASLALLSDYSNEELNSVKFLFAGDGPLRAELEAEALRLNVRPQVEFLGELGNEEVLRQMASAHLVLLASHAEGMPVSIAESMLIGTPVAATTVGGIPELIDHGSTGFLYEPHRPRALVEVLIYALRNPAELAQISERARSTALSKYTIESVAPVWRQLYSRQSDGKSAKRTSQSDGRSC